MLTLHKRFVIISLLLLVSLILAGIGLEECTTSDWAGTPDGDVTPILIKRSFFGRSVVFNKVRRDNPLTFWGTFSTVTLEGTVERTPGNDPLPYFGAYVSADARGVISKPGMTTDLPSAPPTSEINFSVAPGETPRSAKSLNWHLHCESPDQKEEETFWFTTPNPGRITKPNGIVMTNRVQSADPLVVTLDQVVTTEAVVPENPCPLLVWNDWNSVKEWLTWWVTPQDNSPSFSRSKARVTWSPQADWMPMGDSVCPNYGPPLYPQEDFANNVLKFYSTLWPEDGPYSVDLLFVHFHEVAGPVNLIVPSSGETPLHLSYSWGKTSVELVSIRAGEGNHSSPQLVMRVRAAGLLIDQHLQGESSEPLFAVGQPLNPIKSITTTPEGYPLAWFSNTWISESTDYFKTDISDKPIDTTCSVSRFSGLASPVPVTIKFMLVDEVRLVHFGVMPQVKAP